MVYHVYEEARDVKGYPKAVQHRSLIRDGDPDVEMYEDAFVKWADSMGQDRFTGDPDGITPHGVYVPTRFRSQRWDISSMCERRLVPRRPSKDSLDIGEAVSSEVIPYHLTRQIFSVRAPLDHHMALSNGETGSRHSASDYYQFPVLGNAGSVGGKSMYGGPLVDALDRTYVSWLNHHMIHGTKDGAMAGVLAGAKVSNRRMSQEFAISRSTGGGPRDQSALIVPENQWPVVLEKWRDSPISQTPSWDGSKIIPSVSVGGTDDKILRGFFDGYCLIEDVGMALRCHLDADPYADVVHWVATVFVCGRIINQDCFSIIEDDEDA